MAPDLATSLDPADASWQVEASGLKVSPFTTLLLGLSASERDGNSAST